MRIADLVALLDNLSASDVDDWIARGWIRPEPEATDYTFSDTDVARVHLIYDLRIRMAFDDDATGVILSLLDEVHGLRRQLLSVSAAVSGQPDDVRTALLSALRDARN